MSDIVSRRVTRDKLMAVLKSHEMVKMMENFSQDVIQTLPDLSDTAQATAEAAQNTANAAQNTANAAQAAADNAQTAADTAQAASATLRQQADALQLGVFGRHPATTPPPTIPADDAQAILAGRVFRN